MILVERSMVIGSGHLLIPKHYFRSVEKSNLTVRNLERKRNIMIEPKLRFKADDESDFPDWEEKKIASLGDMVGGAKTTDKEKGV